MAKVRIIFMGSADLSCPIFQALLDCPDYQVVGVVTQPDRPRGRDMRVVPTPVKELALTRGLPVHQPERARSPDFLHLVRELRPDLVAVAAFGQILSQELLDVPSHGCLNVHTSLLPKYRGAAPIQWAIVNGETETGVTIMKMDKGLDTGGILAQSSTPIQDEDDSPALHDRLAQLGANLLVDTIPGHLSGRIRPRPQPAEGVSYAPRIKKQDGKIEWTMSARLLWQRLRGFRPWPGLFTTFSSGDRQLVLKVWEATPLEEQGPPGVVLRADRDAIVVGCLDSALRITRLQLEGGKQLSAREFLAGHPLKPGQPLAA